MGWSGGIYYPDYNFVQDEENNIPILASRFQDQFNKICLDGISGCWARDGSNVPTSNLDLGANKFTTAIAAAASDEFPIVNQIQSGEFLAAPCTSAGDGNYVGALDPVIFEYYNSMMVVFQPDQDNPDGSNPTLNLNSIGAREILDMRGGAITEGSLIQSQGKYILVFQGLSASGKWILIGEVQEKFQGGVLSASYADGTKQLLNDPDLNNMLLYWDTQQIATSRFVTILNEGPPDYNVGIRPEVAGLWYVRSKVTAYAQSTLDGYIGCGAVLRSEGATPLPDAAQIDYRYYKGGTGSAGAGPTALASHYYTVTADDLANDRYFPFFGIWKANSGPQPYIDENVMSALFIGKS